MVAPGRSSEEPLPLYQRARSEVFAIERQEIERVKHGRAAAAQKVVELRSATCVQAYDFPVEHRLAIQVDVDGRGESGEPLVCVPAARDEARLVGAHVRERPESVHLQLKEEVVVVERVTDVRRRGRREQ